MLLAAPPPPVVHKITVFITDGALDCEGQYTSKGLLSFEISRRGPQMTCLGGFMTPAYHLNKLTVCNREAVLSVSYMEA